MERTVGAKHSATVHGGTLVVMTGKASATKVAIGPEPLVVGRADECGLVLKGDPHVSGVHFEVSADARSVRIKDLGSTNGTFVEGVRVRDADLVDRATIGCGGVTLEFVPTGKERIEVPAQAAFGDLVGRSQIMQQVFARIAKASTSLLTVLLLGETGVGKEVVARTIHEQGPRKDKPYLVVDCGSIPANLAESVLFGHEKGAFTGANTAKLSPFIEADGGTLFLDEIGELPLDIQTRLLRVLAEKRVKAIGASRERAVNVRIIAATRRNLKVESNRDRFRSDLYFRLAQLPILIPPLRERAEDIPALVTRLLTLAGREPGSYRFARGSLELLMARDWPGNVRELRNVVERAAHFCEGERIIDFSEALRGDESDPEEAAPAPSARATVDAQAPVLPYREAVDAFELDYFTRLWQASKHKVSTAAHMARLDRRTIRPHLQDFGLLQRPSAKKGK